MVLLVEIFPGFALYRGVYEFQKYATFARNGADVGMRWKNLSDTGNGMKTAMIIMVTEWVVMLLLAYYLDQVVSSGSGRTKSPFFFLPTFRKKPTSQQSMQRNSSQVLPGNNQSDVDQEVLFHSEQLSYPPPFNLCYSDSSCGARICVLVSD